MWFCLRPTTSGYGFVLRRSKLPSTLRKLVGVLDIIPCITVPPALSTAIRQAHGSNSCANYRAVGAGGSLICRYLPASIDKRVRLCLWRTFNGCVYGKFRRNGFLTFLLMRM